VKFNTNLIALAMLALMYLASIAHFTSLYVSYQPNEEGEERKVIRVVHWQLEPGYREGLEWAINEYNNLPHVKKANVHVEQQGVPHRVYVQFLNVHLIAGTAPDIAVKPTGTEVIKGSAIARFFMPLSGDIGQPNKYNAEQYLPEDISPELAKFLQESSWSDTFIDGMKGGYDTVLNDYYAIPVSTWGGQRFFLNLKLVKLAKQVALRALEQEPHPEWLASALIGPGEKDSEGFLPDSPDLRAWLAKTDRECLPPRSLGEFLLLCEAIMAHAKESGEDTLVAISGSSYSANTPGDYTYAGLFTKKWADEMDIDRSTVGDGLETVAGYKKGVWSFDSPEVRESFKLMKVFTRYYPPGFYGLDREQAQRRFVTGNAMVFSTGGWDASSIFRSVAKRSEAGRFDIEVVAPPVPVEGERWHEYFDMSTSEAEFSSGVPMTVNKATKHPEWCVDFLRFLTSFTVNEEFNQRTGWASVIVGADPIPEMIPFLPEPEGYPPSDSFSLPRGGGTIPQIKHVIDGNTKLVMTGEIDYETFVERVEEAFSNPVLGVKRQWFETWRKRADRTLPLDQSLNVEAVRQYLLDDESAEKRRTYRLFDVINNDDGYFYRLLWERYYQDEPFPTQ